MFNFRRLINKYKKQPAYLKVSEEGFHDYDNGGEWVEGVIRLEEIDGAVLPLEEKVIYDNARYTSEDKRIYSYTELEENDSIQHKDRLYTLMELTDYSEYDTNLYTGILKAGGKDD